MRWKLYWNYTLGQKLITKWKPNRNETGQQWLKKIRYTNSIIYNATSQIRMKYTFLSRLRWQVSACELRCSSHFLEIMCRSIVDISVHFPTKLMIQNNYAAESGNNLSRPWKNHIFAENKSDRVHLIHHYAANAPWWSTYYNYVITFPLLISVVILR